VIKVDRLVTPSYDEFFKAYEAINGSIAQFESEGCTILSVQILKENYNPYTERPYSVSYVLVYKVRREDERLTW
jgi:hypothetical protein